MASCSKQSMLKICPIQLVFLFIIIFNVVLSSPTLLSTSSVVTLSIHMIFSIFLQHHISNLLHSPPDSSSRIEHLSSVSLSSSSCLSVSSASS
uniref:Putative product n=1 Tax=Xenopsylla cheopis TaxID=163159 RepID=A0A6M2DX67_XENCH